MSIHLATRCELDTRGTLIAAMETRSSCTSQTCVSTPSARASGVASRRLMARFLYPAVAAESASGSSRFFTRTTPTSRSRATAARQSATPLSDSK